MPAFDCARDSRHVKLVSNKLSRQKCATAKNNRRLRARDAARDRGYPQAAMLHALGLRARSALAMDIHPTWPFKV